MTNKPGEVEMIENETRLSGVRTFFWNPVRSADELGPGAPVNNFGDLLGPIIVSKIIEGSTASQMANKRLLSVGSVLHFARDGDVVWGSGINGKIPIPITTTRLDVRAVRGPRTRRQLRELGINVPTTMADPGLLLPILFPELALTAKALGQPLLVPNLNDVQQYQTNPYFCSPLKNPRSVIRSILGSEIVVGTSLHALIVADAFGIPSRPIRSSRENVIKYLDYYEGTQRYDVEFADSFEHAIKLGPVKPGAYDVKGLLTSFPWDLWPGLSQPNFDTDTVPLTPSA